MYASVVILVVTAFKLLGTNILVKFNSLILVISSVPVIIYVFWGSKNWNPKAWTSTAVPEGFRIDYTMFSSWLLWLYSGFFRSESRMQAGRSLLRSSLTWGGVAQPGRARGRD